MGKKKSWKPFLILAVAILTIYQILPTLFYYSQPLSEAVSLKDATKIEKTLRERINHLEEEGKAWLSSFCHELKASPTAIIFNPQEPEKFLLSFQTKEEAARVREHLPRAGSLIFFAPAQLSLLESADPKTVAVQRKIPLHVDKENPWFSFAEKGSPLYKKAILERAVEIASLLGGESPEAKLLQASQRGEKKPLDLLSYWILSTKSLYEKTPSLGKKMASRLTQGEFASKEQAVQGLIETFEEAKKELAEWRDKPSDMQQMLEEKIERFSLASQSLKTLSPLFSQGSLPLQRADLIKDLQETGEIFLKENSFLFASLKIDWEKEEIRLTPAPSFLSSTTKEPLLIEALAQIRESCKEELVEKERQFTIPFHSLSQTSALLLFDLKAVATARMERLQAKILSEWTPQHPDFQQIPIVRFDEFAALSPKEKRISLLITSPLVDPVEWLEHPSIYVQVKGLDQIAKLYETTPSSEVSYQFQHDLKNLSKLLEQEGFFGYKKEDILFENPHFATPLLQATRENFISRAGGKSVYLELSTKEQRLLVENKIDTEIHEELLKWQDEYQTAKISPYAPGRFEIPKPTKSPLWSNLCLTWKKMLRGDANKTLRWGLDLSGGKTVLVELKDQAGNPVTEEIDLKQGIEEITRRVNRIGLSEVVIRQMGTQICLDFPSSQVFSAKELIQASTLSFHLVQEKFSLQNPHLGSVVNQFLQEIWNQAIVEDKQDPVSISELAWHHLHANSESPQSEAGKILKEAGLTLLKKAPSSSFTEALTGCKVVRFRGDDPAGWHGQSHPLMLVFSAGALQGADLENIRASYDPSKGNYLSFDVKALSFDREGKRFSPQETFFEWTSRFAKEEIQGTAEALYSQGRGWRMAVLLNEEIVSAPSLESALKQSAMISGNFSQREVQKLASDLKGGALTFIPHILSEKNVSPELGQTDRIQGIFAMIVALALVVAAMIAYYRFAGFIASIAVFFNLLILWATLQNLGATLTLAGIAGIILTVGMAVDANVLVFERIKEELLGSKSLKSAIAIGYKKAYSAIIDSNLTTIIAALILLNFDAGPAKSFAINLIIGIGSSMFTALFATRAYFDRWTEKKPNQTLRMSHAFQSTHFNFLRMGKFAARGAVLTILLGLTLGGFHLSSLCGMDFTGGYALEIELSPGQTLSPLSAVEEALAKQGLPRRLFQVKELSSSHQLRLLLSTRIEQPGEPFFNMPFEERETSSKFPFETNPRIRWIAEALAKENLFLSPDLYPHLHEHWTSVSGQLSDRMRSHALWGLGLSLLLIFAYLSLRFESKFALAALLCVIHDVLITLALVGILFTLNVPIELDLNTIAALLTIIGYSLNDTIIIFDRIREEMALSPTKKLPDLVNGSLNATLSRTLITSGTTLIALIALVLLGGTSIFSFALVMTIGIFFGTLSSWFIAAPLVCWLHVKEEKGSHVLPSS